MKYLTLFLIMTAGAFAQTTGIASEGWLQDGNRIADTESKKSVDGFAAQLLVTSDADWQKKWETPANVAPMFKEAHQLKRGDKVWILIFFANPKVNQNSEVDVKCDFKITKPNGVVNDNKGLKAMKTKLRGLPTNIFLADPVIEMDADNDDPLGVWAVDVNVYDTVRDVTVPLKTRFTLQ
jgi:hypothetical protein